MASGDSPANPLAPPRDRALLDQFRALHDTAETDAATTSLTQLCAAFAAVPYENLTKIVKYAHCRTPAAARRAPQEVLHDYEHYRAGGTCFSLTATLLHLVRALGYRADPILADRRYGADTHCALLVWMNDQPCLLDPGYLIVEPIPLLSPATTVTVNTRFNQLELVPSAVDRLELSTIHQGNRRYRLTFKIAPADGSAFLQAWNASFQWESMHYPVLSRVTESEQLYLRDTHLQKRTSTTVEREVVAAHELAARIVQVFGVRHDVVQAALDVLL
jgi:arylamine N-acetyltransferase